MRQIVLHALVGLALLGVTFAAPTVVHLPISATQLPSAGDAEAVDAASKGGGVEVRITDVAERPLAGALLEWRLGREPVETGFRVAASGWYETLREDERERFFTLGRTDLDGRWQGHLPAVAPDVLAEAMRPFDAVNRGGHAFEPRPRLRVSAHGYEPAERYLPPLYDELLRAHVALEPGNPDITRMTVEVVDPAGNPVPRALAVMPRGHDPAIVMFRTASDGTATMTATGNSWRVRILAEEFPLRTYEATREQVTTANGAHHWRIELARSPILHLRFRTAEGEPANRAEVTAQDSTRTAIADDEGRVRLPLEPDTWRLQVFWLGGNTTFSVEELETDTVQPIDLTVAAPPTNWIGRSGHRPQWERRLVGR